MDDKSFFEMFNDIDKMSPKEYWKLQEDAKKLADFPPEEFYIEQENYEAKRKVSEFTNA